MSRERMNDEGVGRGWAKPRYRWRLSCARRKGTEVAWGRLPLGRSQHLHVRNPTRRALRELSLHDDTKTGPRTSCAGLEGAECKPRNKKNSNARGVSRTRTGDRQDAEGQSAAVKGQVQSLAFGKFLKKETHRENFAKRYTLCEQWKIVFKLPRWIKDLKNVETYYVCGLRKLNIFKMSILLKLYWKSQEALLVVIDKLDLKFIWKCKGFRILKATLTNRVEELFLSEIQA